MSASSNKQPNKNIKDASKQTQQGRDDEEQAFWDLVDKFVMVANDSSDEIATSTVSSAMLYASARFNAFIASAEAQSADQLKSQRSGAMDFFTGQYKGMLGENLDDYIDNFDDERAE